MSLSRAPAEGADAYAAGWWLVTLVSALSIPKVGIRQSARDGHCDRTLPAQSDDSDMTTQSLRRN